MEANKSFGWGRKLLVLAALVPLGLATAGNLTGAKAEPINFTRTSPALVFSQYLVNLGPIQRSSQKYVFTRFVFRNYGTKPVTIKELKPSCGCLQPRLAKKEYLPGERGEFLVRVSTATESPGQHDYFVTMTYNDPQPREATLQFQFSLPEKQVDIQPRSLVFYQLNGNPATQKFVVTDYRNQPLNVKNVSVTSKLITAKLLSTKENKAGHQQTEISVTVQGKIPPGKHQALVMIETDDTDFETMSIPLWIQGPTEKQAGTVIPEN